MGKVQAFVEDELLKQVKKDAIDEDITIGNYVSKALVARLEQRKEEAKEESVNQSNITTEKEI